MHIIQAYHKKISHKIFNSWEALHGFQLKYIYFINKSCINDLNVPILPFSEIYKVGAGMYKGITIQR